MVGILLDTCVLSELVKPLPNPAVEAWVAGIPSERLFLSVITLGEVARGTSELPVSTRRSALELWIAETEASFGERVIPIDAIVAHTWGAITGRLRAQGVQLAPTDGLIAATALVHRLAVVTRNVKDFEATGVDLLNPWDE